MAEEIDLSASLDNSDYSNDRKARKGFFVKLGFFIVGLLAVVLTFTLSLTGFFAPTSFQEDVSLKEDVSRWTNLSWSYGGDRSTITNVYGEWVDKDDKGVFVNDENGCYIRLVKIPSDSGDKLTDLESTTSYKSIFGEGTSFDIEETDFISIDNKPGRLEVATIYYKLDAGDEAKAYFRSNVKSGVSYTVVISCDTIETFEEVSSVPLETLGVSLKD